MENFNNDNNYGYDYNQNQGTPDENSSQQGYSAPQGDYSQNYYGYTSEGGYSYTPYTAPTPTSPPKKEKKGHSTWVIILCAAIAAVIGFTSSAVVFLGLENGGNYSYGGYSSSDDVDDDRVAEGNGGEININVDESVNFTAQAVAEKNAKSVVGIRVTVSGNFGSTSSGGEGSGVVYTADGYIVTNYHVIEYAVKYKNSRIDVFFDNASTDPFVANVVGYNIAADLAVIKIKGKNLTPADLGDSDKLKVGQYVVTLGSPGGLEFMGSVTYGIISGLNRQVSSDSNIGLIQTDAAINPGNSGGALLDTAGKLIGINSSKIVSEEFEGMGFAIPINTVKKICKDIMENKTTGQPYLGISINERYTAEVLKEYGLPAGAVVYSVASGGPAEAAGIRKNDIITSFNGVAIKEYDELSPLVKKCSPGDKVTLLVYRNGKTYKATVTIGANTAG